MDLFVGVFCGNKLVLLVVCVVADKVENSGRLFCTRILVKQREEREVIKECCERCLRESNPRWIDG